MTILEKRFEQDMISIYTTAKKNADIMLTVFYK